MGKIDAGRGISFFRRFREAIGAFAENQKIAAVRKVYQKAILTPMVSVELLWKDYCAFEMVSGGS